MSAATPELSAAPLFAALGDSTRLHLLARLSADGPLSITRLTAQTAITRQAVTKHLHVLEDAGLVHGAKRGREQVYALDPARLEAARRYLEAVSRQWDAALGRLRALVES